MSPQASPSASVTPTEKTLPVDWSFAGVTKLNWSHAPVTALPPSVAIHTPKSYRVCALFSTTACVCAKTVVPGAHWTRHWGRVGSVKHSVGRLVKVTPSKEYDVMTATPISTSCEVQLRSAALPWPLVWPNANA